MKKIVFIISAIIVLSSCQKEDVSKAEQRNDCDVCNFTEETTGVITGPGIVHLEKGSIKKIVLRNAGNVQINYGPEAQIDFGCPPPGVIRMARVQDNALIICDKGFYQIILPSLDGIEIDIQNGVNGDNTFDQVIIDPVLADGDIKVRIIGANNKVSFDNKKEQDPQSNFNLDLHINSDKSGAVFDGTGITFNSLSLDITGGSFNSQGGAIQSVIGKINNGNFYSKDLNIKNLNLEIAGAGDLFSSFSGGTKVENFNMIISGDAIFALNNTSIDQLNLTMYNDGTFLVDNTMIHQLKSTIYNDGTLLIDKTPIHQLDLTLHNDGVFHEKSAKSSPVENAVITVDGKGKATFYGINSIEGKIVGDGLLYYRGDPEINVETPEGYGYIIKL